jgi:ribosome maturation factor RimP
MKFPAKLVLVPVLVLLLTVGLTAGVTLATTALASSGESHQISRFSGGDYHRGIRGVRGIIREVAEALDLEVSEVVAQLREGKTLAQIIQDNGSTTEAVLEDLLAEQRERLQEAVDEGRITQEQMDERLARLEERYTRALNNEQLGRLAERGSHFRFGGKWRAKHHGLVRGVADALGLEVSEVVVQLREGKTLNQIIEDNGSTAEEVVDGMLEDIRARLLERLNASP